MIDKREIEIIDYSYVEFEERDYFLEFMIHKSRKGVNPRLVEENKKGFDTFLKSIGSEPANVGKEFQTSFHAS